MDYVDVLNILPAKVRSVLNFFICNPDKSSFWKAPNGIYHFCGIWTIQTKKLDCCMQEMF